jgi:hypothetical protein
VEQVGPTALVACGRDHHPCDLKKKERVNFSKLMTCDFKNKVHRQLVHFLSNL